MTRQEAIKVMKGILKATMFDDRKEAVEMAIRSLEAREEVKKGEDYAPWKARDLKVALEKTRWKITIDNGLKMYTCPECECRMVKYNYDYAVGLRGYSFCPYCGARMEK